MRNHKKWLASILAIAITLGDCGGMTALATENAINEEISVSENTIVFDEIPAEEEPITDTEEPMSEEETKKDETDHSLSGNPAEDADLKGTDDTTVSKTDLEYSLPAIQIGQISKGESLPATDDNTFLYDLPISFTSEEPLILFVNYDIESLPEATEKGSLKWSILRGEKGLELGSTSLLNEEDDWDGFETVQTSPFFTMEEITDRDSDYYQMMLLVSEESAAPDESDENDKDFENYDYYIRAAFYPQTENGKTDAFYTAATIPIAPQNDADQMPEDDGDADRISDESAGTEESPTASSSVSENSTDVDNGLSEDTLGGNATADDSLTEDIPENEDAENADTENADGALAADPVSTLSENNSMSQELMLAEGGEELPPFEMETDLTLILYQGAVADEETVIDGNKQIPMSPGDTQQITAKIVPETTPTDILWESGDETVATVAAGANGTATVTALAEGYARITASLGGKSASFIVDVVPDKTNPDSNKLIDLSGDIRVAGFEKESESLVYTGQKITQNLRVYHKNTLLTEKTDYTLSYKNNVNAAAWNSTKAPSVTINLKGQYQGSVTLYYTIKPFDINNIDIYNTEKPAPGEADSTGINSPGYEQTVNYSKKLKIPAPALTFGKKKLAVKKDFICDYTALPQDYTDGDSYTPGQIYTYTVNGTGNFTGSFPMQLVVLQNKNLNFDSASVKLDKKQYEYHGSPLVKSDIVIAEVKLGGQILEQSQYDYEVYASGPEGAYVMLSPTVAGRNAGYRGCKKITLKLVGDRKISDAVTDINWKDSIPFSQKIVDKNGGLFQEKTNLLAYQTATGTDTLSEGTDYTIKYSNAKKAGKVTVTFTGKGRYNGSHRLTYTITTSTNIRIVPGKNVSNENGTYKVAYQKGGAIPELILKDQDYTILKNKTDYTIKYKDNKTPNALMTCEITGKGNYKGYEKTVTLMVTKAALSKCTISVPDKPYSDKPNKWQSAVTVTDTNGKKLSAGTDYDKDIVYTYSDGSPIAPDAVLPVGTSVTVQITGTGNYEGTLICKDAYRIYDKAHDISKLKIVIDPQEYTGEEITLTPIEDIHVYANNADAREKRNEIITDCYDIVEYKNNIKSGTAKVTLRGKGNYGGTKTYSFKILKKNYRINHVKEIKLDKSNLAFSLLAKDTEKMLTATITPESADQVLANPTVIWSSSDNNIATVSPADTNVDVETSPTNALTSSVIIQAKKDGKVTITAIAQDGNKKAQCKVTVSIPKLKQAGQTIQGKVGDTYQLTFIGYEDQSMVTDGIEFTSDNPNVVSVDPQTGLLTMHKLGASTIKVEIGGPTNVQKCYVVVDGTIDDPENDSRALVYHQKEGCTDDTPYINKMLRDWEWGDRSRYDYMYLPAGDYHIDATAGEDDELGNYKFGGIVLTDNQTLIMDPGTRLIAIGNSKSNTEIIHVFGRSNVTISGGQIIGERDSHTGSAGEWGHGIAIFGSTNVYIKDVEVSKCWGDGIYLGKYDNTQLGNPTSNGVTITNCNVHDNRRNNLSITDASNITVRSCSFNYANGKDPQYGIDIEPNRGQTCSNVTISDCTFKGNAKGTIQILGQLNAHVKGVTIENCTGDTKPVQWQGFGGSVSGVTEKNNKWSK